MAVAIAQLMCSDEAIWLRASGDYELIAPASQRIAHAKDGAFDASARWQLTSASASFSAGGVMAGQVVKLTKAGAFDASGEFFVVDSVDSDSAITLRRPGLQGGEGLPPGPTTGATSVEYEIITVRPQVEIQTYKLRKKYQIDENLARRTYADLYDPREVEDLCAWKVLCGLYADAWKDSDGDVWKAKMAACSAMASEVEASTLVRWGAVGNDQPPTTHFGTRISR